MSKIYSYREWHQKIYEEAELEGGDSGTSKDKSGKPKDSNKAWNDGHLDSNQYEDVKSGLMVFSWHNTSAIIECDRDPGYSVSATDLFNYGDYLDESYIPSELKTAATLLKVAGEDQKKAAAEIFSKCQSGEWEVLPERANPNSKKPGGFFKWMPTDNTCQKWRIEPVISKQFGGPIAWVFEDNAFCKMKYSDSDVKSDTSKAKGISLNGFVKTGSAGKTHPFKPGDVIYINISDTMVNNSGANAEQKEWMMRMDGVTKVTSLSPDLENETMKKVLKQTPDLVITEVGHPGVATPAMGGYIVLLERGGSSTGGGIGGGVSLYQQRTF